MRTLPEIRFRLRQEAENLLLAAFPPSPGRGPRELRPLLPSTADVRSRLRGTRHEDEVHRAAQAVMAGRLPLLGTHLETGPEIRWRRDPVQGIETPAIYFRRIPYLDPTRAGDHKIIWELNRHQHLALLAQSHTLRPDRTLTAEIERQLRDWLRHNPFQRGINWTSALEVAFRALSWIWILHLAGEDLTPEFYDVLLEGLYRHGRHLECNLSIYFSPNTHLLGEAVALHALGALFPSFPHAKRWQQTGADIVREQLARQVRGDGSHFEQSSYYQVYTIDMFVFHGVLAGFDTAYRARLATMLEYLDALHSPIGELPLLGDDDGGRFFFPYGTRTHFGRATLATGALLLNRPDWLRDAADLDEQAAWWLRDYATGMQPASGRQPPSRFFPDAGLASLRSGDVQVLADAGPLGAGSGGHSHSDTLSIVVNAGPERILIDPGTYTYVGDPGWRDRFRGSAAHNTIRIDGLDQALPAGPFRWNMTPEVTVTKQPDPGRDHLLEASCAYRGFRHTRRFDFREGRLLILDHIEGPAGDHRVEQWWHPGEECRELAHGVFAIGTRAVLALSTAATLSRGGEFGWKSKALAQKSEADVIQAVCHGPLSIRLVAALDFTGEWLAHPDSARPALEGL